MKQHPRPIVRTYNSRSLALQALLDCQQGTAFVQEILDKHLSRTKMPPADRRLATQLTYGVLRRRATLDRLIKPCVSRRKDQVEPWLWEALRLGTFQLGLLSNIPPHAAIFETVTLAELVGKPRGKGFLNGVLRNVSSLLTQDKAEGPAADSLPLNAGEYQRLTQPIFPDPKHYPVEYISSGFSWPFWLAQRWHERHGWDECVRLGFWFGEPPPVYLRSNRLLTKRDEYLDNLENEGIDAKPCDYQHGIQLLEPESIQSLPGYADGLFAVQDESSMRVAAAVAPTPGRRVLDLCAAPGGKTSHMAELMNNEGEIVACDIDKKRLKTLRELCFRLRLRNVKTHHINVEALEDPPEGPFDYVLVDVPCSNTGVLGRRPEARWRLTENELQRLIPLQTKLLIQAAERVRPGGTIVYSTCSIEPEENENVVQVVLKALPCLSLEAEEAYQPGQPSDGGFWAKLKRK
ncbi:MAG: 16S rRNA (cytosine(967)-C(5))-methyltransferase RsmB [Gemmataceae bacterium]